MTLEQKQTLESFSVKRDALLLDLSNLQKEKDTLQRENKNLSESTQAIKIEAGEKSKEILNLEGQISRLEDMVRRAEEYTTKTLSVLDEKRVSLEQEIDFKVTILKELSDLIDRLESKSEAIELTLSKTSQDVSKVISQVNSHLASATNLVSALQSSSEKFNSFVVEKEQDIVRRIGELDKKYSLLQAREKAIDDRYNSLVTEINESKQNIKV